ncbi:MAG: 50S ribosomal protein L29 [Phycisphaerales bacterium]|nr:MAG: 50S ribosomal protein L29 [Phycisphaerales bacterium]
MAKKKTSELKQEIHKYKDEEIVLELKRLRNTLFDLRTQAVTEKIQDSSRFGKVRRDIARLLTERRARELRDQKATA